MKLLCKTIIFLSSFLLALQNVFSNPLQLPQCKNTEECKLDELCDDGKCVKILSNEVINKRFCVTTRDCPSTYVCNNAHVCSEVETTMDVMRRQTCQGVFKSYCSSDLSCACNEDIMVCEERECVYKSQEKKRKTFPCQQHTDCSFGLLCSNNKCIEDQSWDFLLQISEIQPKEKYTKNNNDHDEDDTEHR